MLFGAWKPGNEESLVTALVSASPFAVHHQSLVELVTVKPSPFALT